MRMLKLFIWVTCVCCFNAAGIAQQMIREKVFVHTDRNYYQTGEIIWLSIFCVDADQQEPSKLSKLVYVEVLDSANNPVMQSKMRLDSGRGAGSMMIPSSVVAGAYTLRCYTNWMKNFGAEDFFHKDIAIVNAANGPRSFICNTQQINPGNLKIDITPRKHTYDAREKITVEITTSDASGKPLGADLSISVYKLDSLIQPDHASISGALSTASEKMPDSFPYLPEYTGHIVSGRMINRGTRLPSKRVPGYLTAMDDGNSFYNAITNDQGAIRFIVTKLNASDSIIVQSDSYYHPNEQLEIESPFLNKYSKPRASAFTSTNSFPSTVLQQSINAQATALYYEDQLNRFNASHNDSTPFYYKSDMHYMLDDFTRFSKIEDVFREYIRPVGVTKRQGNFHLMVFNSSNRYISDQQPLVLVDGLPVFNTNTLFAYDPLKVKTVDVVTDRYYRSGSVFQGIINMRTYRGRTDGELIDPNASVLAYEIVQRERTFYSPSYDTGSDMHLPDFRTTLYWNPSVKSDGNGKALVEFYAGDLNGEFFISVQGISKSVSGNAGSSFSIK